MKNIETILSDFGITIPEGKAADLRKAVAENYKTVAEYTKLQERRDALDTSLKDVQGKLAAFDGVDVAALKGQITTLTNDLQTERDNRKKDAAAVKLRSTVDTFLSGKHFVNDITRESITDKLVTALGSDDARGKSIDDLFTGLVTDQNGKEIPRHPCGRSRQQGALFVRSQRHGAAGGGRKRIRSPEIQKQPVFQGLRLRKEMMIYVYPVWIPLRG